MSKQVQKIIDGRYPKLCFHLNFRRRYLKRLILKKKRKDQATFVSIIETKISAKVVMEIPTSESELDELHRKYLNTPLYNKGSVYEGYVLPVTYANLKNEIDQFEVYDDDVWVASFPRSGTVWLQYMIWCILNRSNLDKQEVLRVAFPYLEYSLCFYEGTEALPDITKNSVQKVKLASRPRLIKTHLPWELLPEQIRTFKKRPKIIRIARDPRDVCVSYYHNCKFMRFYTGNFELFWQFFLTDRLFGLPFTKHILSYQHQRHQPNVLLVQYRDMKSNLRYVLESVAKFLDVILTEDEVTTILKCLDFEAMKSNPLVNRKSTVEMLRSEKLCSEENYEYLRNGRCGSYEEVMGDAAKELFRENILKPLFEEGVTF